MVKFGELSNLITVAAAAFEGHQPAGCWPQEQLRELKPSGQAPSVRSVLTAHLD